MKNLGSRLGDRVLTLPNALTFARLLFIPIILLLLLAERDMAAVGLFVVAAATDFLDGKLARRRGGAAASYLGAVLDPVADRLMLSSVAALLAVRGILPFVVVAVLVGRDALALLGTLAFRGKIKVNKVGKAATAMLMASVAVIMYRPDWVLGEVMFYAGLGLSLVAGLMYVGAIRRKFGVGSGR